MLPGLIDGFETDYALGMANKGRAVNLDGIENEEVIDLETLEKGYSEKYELNLIDSKH